MKKAKKIFSLILVTTLVCCLSVSAFAAENTDKLSSNKKIIQIAVPDGKGGMHIFTGNEAQAEYKKLEALTDVEISDNKGTEITDYDGPQAMFSYKYRFVKSDSGVKYGSFRRISTYAGNATSVLQSMSITASTTQKWSINTTLTGMFKSVFQAAVSSNWEHSCTFSETFTRNIPSKKRVWLEFKPLLRYIKGESQKYYITRGRGLKRVTVIENRKYVYSTSPTTVRKRINEKYYNCPDGAYVWCEDSNYYSN